MTVTTNDSGATWIEYVADGTVKRFDIPFPYLADAHIVVRDSDTLKTIATHYTVDNDTKTNGLPEIVFGTAPTNTHIVRIARKTPRDAVYSEDPQRGNTTALQALYLAQERFDEPVSVPFDIPATELSAGTTIEGVAPCNGTLKKLWTIIQTAIVTGGDITVKNATTDVAGLSITVADSATKGTVQSDTPTAGDATTRFKRGDRFQVVPSSGFNGGGAVSGKIDFMPDP